jgi:ketosteroid isomerase-like protein
MKRIITVALFFLASTAIIEAQTQKGYRDEKVERELIELVRKWDNASVKRDVATLDLLLADEFTLSGTTKKEYLAFIKSSTDVIESAVSDNFDVRVYKDMAVLIARDTIKLERNGVKVVEVYRYIDVWVKRAGRWQCVVTESYAIKQP